MSYIYNNLYKPSIQNIDKHESTMRSSMLIHSLHQGDAFTTRPSLYAGTRLIRPVHQAMLNVVKTQIALRKAGAGRPEYEGMASKLEMLRELSHSWFFIKSELRKIVVDTNIPNPQQRALSYIKEKTGLILSPPPALGADLTDYLQSYLSVFENPDFDPEDLFHAHNKIKILSARENLNKLSDIVKTERNSGAMSQERSLLLDNVSLSLASFSSLAGNWDRYCAIVDSDFDDPTKQTMLNNELGIAVHANSILKMNILVILCMIGKLSSQDLTLAYALEKFSCHEPCMEARSNFFLGLKEESPIKHQVDPKKSIDFNIGVYYSLYTTETGQEDDVDAGAFYEWLINQDAFIGQPVSDGTITTHSVLDFIKTDPLFFCEFEASSIQRCLTKYDS